MAFRPRILILENDPATLRLVTTTLRINGAEPFCPSLDDHLDGIVEREKVDGVFLSWDLLPSRGEELVRRIRSSKSGAGVPIVILAGRHQQHATAEAFRAGATFSLTKPVGVQELQQLLNVSRGAMLEERRRYERIPVRGGVSCEWDSGKRHAQAEGKCLNISSTGMLVRLAPQPSAGTAISLSLHGASRERNLRLRGFVSRAAGGRRVGIEFAGLTGEQQALLDQYMVEARKAGRVEA